MKSHTSEAHGSDWEPPSGVRHRCAAASGDFDAKAFHAFAKREYGRAADWARVLHVDEDDADEALQLAMICLWEKRATVAASRWPAWLWIAAVLRKATILRAKTRARKRQALITFEFFEECLAPSPEVELYRQHCERELLWLVDQVKPGRRDVVELHLLEGLPLSEVATALNIPEGTAKTRWARGLKDMRDAYARRRAKEEFLLLAATLAATATAFLVAVGARLARLFGRGAAAMAAGRSALGLDPSERRPDTGRAARSLVLAAVVGLVILATGAAMHDPIRRPAISEGERSGESATASAASPAGAEPIPASSSQPAGFMSAAPAASQRGEGSVASQKRASGSSKRGIAPSKPAPRETSAPPLPATAADAEAARGLLNRATAAIHGNHPEVARGAVRLYEEIYPENPFPAQYAALKKQVTP
jgi:RNA polymerase sigma factor (sigma-70 family)